MVQLFRCIAAPAIFALPAIVAGQGVGINTTSPHSSAALHVQEAENKGLLIPRIENTNHIESPEEGLLVYDASRGNLVYYHGVWIEIAPVPPGTVIMWSGSPNNLPEGWVLCDGRSYNLQGNSVAAGSGFQTPDLRGKFIVGYSGSGDYASIGQQGGAKAVTLTTSQLPAHSHSVSSNHTHSMTVSTSPHSHEFSVTDIARHDIGGYPISGLQGVVYSEVKSKQQTNEATTNVTVNTSTTGVSVSSAGSGGSHENRPPYYVLAFIMKL